MIKIEEKDVLWKFYQRNYKYQFTGVPCPSNLCNYFWSSVNGFLKYLFWDINFLIPTIILLIICFSSWNTTQGACKGILNFLMLWVFVISLIASIGLPICRWFQYLESKKRDGLQVASGVVLFLVFFDFLLTASLIKEGTPWSWWFLLYGIMIEAIIFGVLGLVVLVVFAFYGNHNLGKNVRQYVGAVKDRVCPLVQPPSSWYERDREKKLNVGDG